MLDRLKRANSDIMLKLFLEGRLYTTIDPRTALLIEIILLTGATPADIVDITPEDINTNNYQLTLHVNKKKTTKAINATLSKQAILTYLKDPHFSRLSIRRIQQLIKKAATEVGSKYTSPRLIRKEYLRAVLESTPAHEIAAKTQLTSLRERRVLTTEELKLLHSLETTPRNQSLIFTLLETGLRISELLRLQHHHVGTGTLHISTDISHNGEERTVPLSTDLCTLLQQQPTFLFCNSKGKPLTQRRFEQICKKLGEQVSIKDLSPRILRATAISQLSTQLSQEELQQQTGLKTTTLYTHGLLASKRVDKSEEHLGADYEARKDSKDSDSSHSQYVRSRLRKGGEDDE